ncbi:putative Ig domain-containing protein [Horticoccus luteus]|uniref:Ig domain-containing protein n=1 Tax=Horticoccus luteus TaxID=2862869 RepID=A0A8F9TU56_9BACT|nr:putative Ig domain-containing protein [Horticoccus luteus]QYM78147.1 putative Ig domain-containing protein [Horticoccus luteus]
MKSASSLHRLSAFLFRAALPLALAFSAPALCAGTPSPITISPPTIAPLQTLNPYAQAFTATGGAAPYTWSTPIVALPAGLALNSTTGLISGTPTKAGSAVIFIRVTDVNGLSTQRGWNVAIAVGAPPVVSNPPPDNAGPPPPSSSASTPLAITPTTLPAGTVGLGYSYILNATGGTPPYTWNLQSGSFPTGLALDAAGHIGGTPASGGAWIYSYPYSVYINVTDSTGHKAAASFPIALQPSPDGSGEGGSTPPPVVTPPSATYTVTVVNGTANGTATATVSAGNTVSLAAAPAPAGQYFKQWSGPASADPFAATTTFVMPAANVTFTANYYTPPPLPAVVAGHPRLWLNQSDLPRLRSWATPSNTLYQQGLRSMLSLALHAYDLCFPNAQLASPYPDSGDINGYSGANITPSDMISEQHALTLAFFGLVDPDPAARLVYAQKARALFMYVINEAAKGHLKGAPFRDPIFSIYNRGNSSGECWPLLADWLQGVTDANGQPVAILTPQDKATIRSVFLLWADDCLNAYTTGGDHPAPIGVTNNVALLPGGNAMRIAANNYYLNHARLITMMPLALDAADDPAVDSAVPASVRGNTLRSYLLNATGAWLYQQFAMFGDPADVRAAYQLPASASVGLASGGTAVEGGLYGHSIGYIQGQLLALQTAGATDPAVFGPQISLLNSPVWDRYVHGLFATMVPQQQVNPVQSYLGPIYEIASIGDLIRLWVTPDVMTTYSLLALTEQKQGRTDHLAAARWIALNAVEGGSAGLLNRIQRPYNTIESILYFMLFDPTDPTALHPADPRLAYGANFYDPGMGRLLARTDWSPNATLFDFRSGWLSINHQNCDGGQIEFYRHGEWLTKELSNYDNYGNGQSTIWHNTLALQNWSSSATPFMQWFEQPYWNNGSQWNNHQSAGDPVTLASSGPGYAAAQTDLTNLYNHPSSNPAGNFTDIQHASRSVVWLQPDCIVIYDRATSLHAGLFKRFNLSLTAAPFIDQAQRQASVITPHGQHLFVQTLLPANATLTYVPEGGTLTNIAQLEPCNGRLVVEDTTRPTDVRFLHVLQGADAAVTSPTAASMVQSTAGTACTGAIVGASVVMFPVNLGGANVGTSYSVPATVTKHYVTGLVPGGSYSVVADSDGVTAQVALTPGGPLTADSAGVLCFDLASVMN